MKKIVFLLIVVLFTFSELDAKKKRRRVRKKKKQDKEIYLEQEQKLFDKEFVYKNKYERLYGFGVGFWGFREDGIPDEKNNVEKAQFYGLSFLGRVDFLRELTFFPALSYTFLDSMSDGDKVFADKTKKLKYGFFTLDADYRFPAYGNIELFAGGGFHLFYRKYDVNYSTSSVNAHLSSSDTDYEIGLNANGYALYHVSKDFSLMASGKIYLINPDFTFGAQVGAIYNFSIKKRK